MKKKTKIVLAVAGLVLLTAAILIRINLPAVKNELMLRFLSPAAYMAIVETDYLTEQSQNLSEHLADYHAAVSKNKPTGADLTMTVNQLASLYFGNSFPLKNAGISFRYNESEAVSQLTSSLKLNGIDCASLLLQIVNEAIASDDTSDAAPPPDSAEQNEKLLYLSCPELSTAALSISLSGDALLMRLLQYLTASLQSFFTSIYENVQLDPYHYLLPFVDVLTEVSLEQNYSLSLGGTTWKVTRMEAALSADTAFSVASDTLEAMKHSETLTLHYRLLTEFFKMLAKHDTDIHIICYADRYGTVLGHEFLLVNDGRTLFSKTGLLFDDQISGQTGDITLSLYSTDKETKDSKAVHFLLSCEQFAINPENGYPEGHISFSTNTAPLAALSLFFDSSRLLPSATVSLRAAGFTAASLKLELNSSPSQPMQTASDYSAVFPLTELEEYLATIDIDSFLQSIHTKTGINLSSMHSMLQNILK